MDRADVARLLADARVRTLVLMAPLDAEDLQVQHSPLMSPGVGDPGPIDRFVEPWLVRNIGPDPEGRQFGEIPGTYRPSESSGSVRDGSVLPSMDRACRRPIRKQVSSGLCSAR